MVQSPVTRVTPLLPCLFVLVPRYWPIESMGYLRRLLLLVGPHCSLHFPFSPGQTQTPGVKTAGKAWRLRAVSIFHEGLVGARAGQV